MASSFFVQLIFFSGRIFAEHAKRRDHVAQELASYLQRGYTLLSKTCPDCNCVLVQNRATSDPMYCVACDAPVMTEEEFAKWNAKQSQQNQPKSSANFDSSPVSAASSPDMLPERRLRPSASQQQQQPQQQQQQQSAAPQHQTGRANGFSLATPPPTPITLQPISRVAQKVMQSPQFMSPLQSSSSFPDLPAPMSPSPLPLDEARRNQGERTATVIERPSSIAAPTSVASSSPAALHRTPSQPSSSTATVSSSPSAGQSTNTALSSMQRPQALAHAFNSLNRRVDDICNYLDSLPSLTVSDNPLDTLQITTACAQALSQIATSIKTLAS